MIPASFPPPGPRLSPSTCDPRPTARRSKRLRACMCVVRDCARRPFAGAPLSRGRRIPSRGRSSQGLAASDSRFLPAPRSPARAPVSRELGGRRPAASAPHPQASRRVASPASAPAAGPACGRGSALHRGPLSWFGSPCGSSTVTDRVWVIYAPAGPRFLHPYNGSIEKDDLPGLFQGLGARIPECRVWSLVGYV